MTRADLARVVRLGIVLVRWASRAPHWRKH